MDEANNLGSFMSIKAILIVPYILFYCKLKGDLSFEGGESGKIDQTLWEGLNYMPANGIYFVETWKGDSTPGETELRRLLGEQGKSAYRWSNSPGDVYGAHSHSFHKIIYVLQGSITFTLPEQDEQVTLNSGDRLDLPGGVLHEAVVGPQGVICLEAHNGE